MNKSLTHHSDEFLRDERKFERFHIEVPARVELLHGKRKERILFTQTLDLSATGALFPELAEMRIGDIVKIDLYLVFEDPDATDDVHDMVAMTVTGKVIRSEASGTAIRFEEDYHMSNRKLLPAEAGRRSSVRKAEKTVRFQKLFRKLWGEETTNLPGALPGDSNDAWALS
ncbi:MAG: PilZ domain-containing protein [Syntrophus sp. (in: bacteria)]